MVDIPTQSKSLFLLYQIFTYTQCLSINNMYLPVLEKCYAQTLLERNQANYYPLFQPKQVNFIVQNYETTHRWFKNVP